MNEGQGKVGEMSIEAISTYKMCEGGWQGEGVIEEMVEVEVRESGR